jgi:dTDP-4-dehydrorhamnose 3,5-epimerase
MNLTDIKIFETDSFKDERGELWTIWNKEEFNPKIHFNHDKVAVSKKNVLRGIHGDNKSWKLITCLFGEILLVVVDPKTLEHTSINLSQDNKLSVLVPPNLGNGHLVLSDKAVFYYKWAYEGKYPDVDDQFSLRWDDPKLNIPWPITLPILSYRDQNAKLL